jgi:hypothetical protein
LQADHEELLLRNPALGACASWHLARSFAEATAGEAPELPYFLVAAAMIFHRPTVEKIHGMRFDSGLVKAVSEQPDVIAGLQARMENNAKSALIALQVGCAAEVLEREGGAGFPAFRAKGNDLPFKIRHGEGDVPRIFNCAKRLGKWFGLEKVSGLKPLLRIEF